MYTPTTWQTGDTITASALNKLEQGVADAFSDVNLTSPQDGQTLVYDAQSGKWKNGAVSGGGGVLVVHSDPDTGVLDKTWKEITDAGFSVVWMSNGETTITWTYAGSMVDDGGYYVYYYSATDSGTVTFGAESQSDYPDVRYSGPLNM